MLLTAFLPAGKTMIFRQHTTGSLALLQQSGAAGLRR
jgi:hypothetical protein